MKALLTNLHEKYLHIWLPAYLGQALKRAVKPRHVGLRHVLFAFCDHYEPLWGGVSLQQGEDRVRFWEDEYPRLAENFRDADGLPPRHTFFFPGDQYDPRLLDHLTSLARQGYGEVELHLHHSDDTRSTLQSKLLQSVSNISQHGHFSRDVDGRIRYGFIHGDWALANSSCGRYCGVDDELTLLFETGCYADFTFPSAPDVSQPRIINQIFWPDGDLSRARSYEPGRRARVGEVLGDRILMVPGPLALVPRIARIPFRIENTAVMDSDPATPRRIATWVAQNIHVEGRPEWVFVKIHTHGAPERQAASLLGEPGKAMHAELKSRFNDGVHWKLHYVTAREMYNIALAAMSGHCGDPQAHRDFRLSPPPVTAQAKTWPT